MPENKLTKADLTPIVESKKPNDRYCDFCKKPGHPTNKCWLYLKEILDGKVDLNQISQDKQVEPTAGKEKEKTPNEKKFNVGAHHAIQPQ